ncbi:MAG: ABC transporter permease subunit [Lachnospiraceae bacterium]|nr:ABC transporter permease subunit [Lachnospiraceae bacterium]
MAKNIEVSNGPTDKIYYVTRISLLFAFVLVFFSEINPARIMTQMNKNMSLLTTALSYDRIVVNIKYEINHNYIFKSDIYSLMAASAIMVAGILILAVAACISLGNLRMKRISNYVTLGGSAAVIFGVYRMIVTHRLYRAIDAEISEIVGFKMATEKLPTALFLMLGFAIIEFLCAVILMIAQPRPARDEKCEMSTRYKLFIMALPFLGLTFIFSYLPLYGWRYAFFDYKAGPGTLSMNDFVGFKWFKLLVDNAMMRSDIIRVMKNTLIMSGLGLATSWVAMAFAIFLSEIKNGVFRRIVQVLTTIPNFISWVLVYAIAFAIFSNEGFVNNMLTRITGVVHDHIYLTDESMLYVKMLLWGMWKGVGWSAIIYIAGISGIDQQLYEAATVDGAGRFQKMWHVTLPGLIPTYSVMLLMAVAGILSNGMDQYLVFSNAKTKSALEVLDLYVYTLGIGSGKIPLSTVIGMLKTLVSVTLLFMANGISKLVRGESII